MYVAQRFSQFLGIYGINLPVPVSSLIWGVIMLLSAIYGIRILSILNYIAVPILLFVCIYGLVVSLNNGGLAVVENYKPAGSMSFMTGLAITIGSFALGAVIAGDYSQYTKSRKDVVKANLLLGFTIRCAYDCSRSDSCSYGRNS